MQNKGILPSPYQPLALVETGILFYARTSEDPGQSAIYYNGWDGKRSQGIFPYHLVDFQLKSVMVQHSVFLGALYERPDATRIASILGVNLETGRIIHYDIGDDQEWSIQTVGKSSDGDILSVACNIEQNVQLIVKLSPSGELKWKTTLTCDLNTRTHRYTSSMWLSPILIL